MDSAGNSSQMTSNLSEESDSFGKDLLDERPTDFILVEECVAIACPDEDECSTPSDYVPPELPSSDDTTALVKHGGDGDLADCGFDTDLAFEEDGPTLQLESKNGNVCVRLERQNEGSGNLANTEWSLKEMQVGPLGGVSLIDDESDLCWYSSHHNFKDWAHLWTGTRHHDIMIALDGHGGERTYELHTAEEGPLDNSLPCAPLADGIGPIGYPVSLFPVNP